jgi:hypothetical protein
VTDEKKPAPEKRAKRSKREQVRIEYFDHARGEPGDYRRYYVLRGEEHVGYIYLNRDIRLRPEKLTLKAIETEITPTVW